VREGRSTEARAPRSGGNRLLPFSGGA
jgi:hypothetical protein